MELIQTNSTLTIFGTESVGYSNVYILQKMDPTTELPVNMDYKVSVAGTTFTLTSDGYYAINKFILSTTPSDTTYYISGEVVYVPGGDILMESGLYDLLLIEDYTETGITYEVTNYFTYYTIETYYLNLLKSKFLKSMCGCGCVSASDRVTIDTLTMGIEVIKSLVLYSQFNEASRILNLLNTCTGIVNTNCNCHG